MVHTCRATGCTNLTATAYGAHCRPHKTRLRRHGSPDQKAITKADLAPYLRAMKARREKNNGHPMWGDLEGRWSDLLHQSRSIIAAYHAGRPTPDHDRQAARAVTELDDPMIAPAVVDTVLALFMMRDHEPRRFKTDRSFLFQIVRRVRGVGDVNVGETWDHRSGKVRRVYRDIPPRAAETLAGWLVHYFGMAGLRMAELERRDYDEKQAKALVHQEALATLV